MRRSLGLTVSVATLAMMSMGMTTTAASPGEVVTSFEAPCRYPAALATGKGHTLYVADWREARVFEIDRTNGKTSRHWSAPVLKPSGLAMAGETLFVCDDHTGAIQGMNLSTGVVETTFQAPHESAAGLAFAGDVLFVLTKEHVYRVLPDDGTILGYFDLPNRGCRGLAHDGLHLWTANRTRDELYMVDPANGKVLGIMASPGPYPSGLAWADGHLFAADFQTRRISKIAVEGEPPYRLSEPRRARVEYLWSLTNYGPGEVRDLTLAIALPDNLPNQKLLSEPVFSVAPARTQADRWGQRAAVFELGRVSAGEKAVVTYSVLAELSAIRYLVLPEKVGRISDIPSEILDTYTRDGSRYRINSPYIQDTVERVVAEEPNPYHVARRLYDFVIGSLEYEMIGGWDVPEVVLQRGSGSCSEYTYAFIALCRAAGLPARYQGSIVARGDDASVDEAFHRWA